MAALIASDVGMPGLAAELCWRQHAAFADAGRLTGDIASMSLMPLINVSRLLTREGDGGTAHDVLDRLHHAAVTRGAAEIHGTAVDLSALTTSDADHRRVVRELWLALMTDGARALARTGRWTDAAEAMAAHRGIGNRLLDGRQIKVMSLMEHGLDQEARGLIDSSVFGEPWERAVGALLSVCCAPPDAGTLDDELDHALRLAQSLLDPPDPETATFQTRVALSALELLKTRPTPVLADYATVPPPRPAWTPTQPGNSSTTPRARTSPISSNRTCTPSCRRRASARGACLPSTSGP